MTDIVLVSMPFGTTWYPSIGLSLLKASLAGDPFSVRIKYFDVLFANSIGHATYGRMAVNGTFVQRELAGEWVFANALSPQSEGDVHKYVDEILVQRQAQMSGRSANRADIAMVLRVRSRVDAFLNRCLNELSAEQPRIVGFTSVFQQHAASLALARRLKTAHPGTFIVFGGANCEGPMGAETLRQFPFLDAVVSGEGDLVFPDLVRRVMRGEPIAHLQGVRTTSTLEQEFRSQRFGNAPMVRNLDDLPYPDYSDFFEQYRASRLRRWRPGLLAETSRGCWWGERQHCTFCGLNGTTMTFRSKSADRALAELDWLSTTYPGSDIQLVDNILDFTYLKTLLPRLAARPQKLELFYETKSNLTKDHVRLLKAAGVAGIQPGIESLSDPILRLMRKGVSAIQNVQLLKWCKELGVNAIWNLLWGFAGESPEEYERMTTLVASLAHLPPPHFISRLRLDRFSPNFVDAERLGYTDLQPLRSYRHVYRVPESALANLAYYFAYDYREPREPEHHVAPLLRALERWQREHGASDLFFVDVGGHIVVWDLRRRATANASPVTVLTGLDRLLYLACDAACDLDHLVGLAQREPGGPCARDNVTARLQAFSRSGLMMQTGARYLSLAVPLGEYRPTPQATDRFHRLVKRLGVRSGRGTVAISLDGLAVAGGRAHRDRPSPTTSRPPKRSAALLTPDCFAITKDSRLSIRIAGDQ